MLLFCSTQPHRPYPRPVGLQSCRWRQAAFLARVNILLSEHLEKFTIIHIYAAGTRISFQHAAQDVASFRCCLQIGLREVVTLEQQPRIHGLRQHRRRLMDVDRRHHAALTTGVLVNLPAVRAAKKVNTLSRVHRRLIEPRVGRPLLPSLSLRARQASRGSRAAFYRPGRAGQR
jgi:hypothetical protein